MCIYFYIYIYILLSLKYLPRPLLISNVDYVPRLWHRPLPLHSGTLLCKDPVRPRPPPSPRPSHLLSAADNRRRSRTEEALGAARLPPPLQLAGGLTGWGLEPSSLRPVVGLWPEAPQHLLRMAEGDPCSSSPGRKPSKGYQGHRGSKCPKGQTKAPGGEEAPSYRAPSSLCCQAVQLLVRTPFRPGALLILDPHLSPCSRVSSSSRNRAPPSSGATADFTPVPPEPAPLPLPAPFPRALWATAGRPPLLHAGDVLPLTPTLTRLSQAPQVRSASPRPPMPWCTGVTHSGSLPPSASWGAALANAEAGSRCVLTPVPNGSTWGPRAQSWQ